MGEESVREPDLINRLAVGRMARELLDVFLTTGRTERAMGLVAFCDALGVAIPDPKPLNVVSDGRK